MQDAAPVLLRSPARIEALFCCQFLALLLGALIERQIRTAMTAAHTADIPLYPELRACTAPSAERILEIFADLTRHELHRDGQLVQTFEPELNPLQQQVLDLLDIPATAYTATPDHHTDGGAYCPREVRNVRSVVGFWRVLAPSARGRRAGRSGSSRR